MLISSSSAKINDCEQVAKENQIKFHTELVFVMNLQEDGAYIFDDKNNAHILNSKIINGKRYYFDFSNQAYESLIFNSKEEASKFYEEITGHKNEVYIIGVDFVPFPIHWES